MIDLYPDLAADIDRHRAALKTEPFEVWQASVAEPLDSIDLAGPSHPAYISLQRYRSLSADDRTNPALLRRMLLHVEHLNTLFYGDGFTRTPDGQVGMAEYLIPNGRVDALTDALVVNFFNTACE